MQATPLRSVYRRIVTVLIMLSASLTLLAAGTASATPTRVWDRIAQCESGGDWHINTGNGYKGGLQFASSTWRGFGGIGHAHQASKAEQIRIAERVLAVQGWKAWPVCSRKAGMR